MQKVVTPEGWEFNLQSFVEIGGKYYDMDDFTDEQLDYIGAQINIQSLNAAFAGEGKFYAEGLPQFSEVFPGLA